LLLQRHPDLPMQQYFGCSDVLKDAFAGKRCTKLCPMFFLIVFFEE
jgi:hypothetical protein